MLTAQLQITGTRSLHLHVMIGTSKRKTSRMDLSRDTFKKKEIEIRSLQQQQKRAPKQAASDAYNSASK